jgi:hypothetical protein
MLAIFQFNLASLTTTCHIVRLAMPGIFEYNLASLNTTCHIVRLAMLIIFQYKLASTDPTYNDWSIGSYWNALSKSGQPMILVVIC